MSALAKRIEALVWVLIYLGLILFGLGLAVRRSDAGLGAGIALAGTALVAVGAVLIWVRSRLRSDP